MSDAYYDVVIVGAGLSGIGAAYHLQTRCPGKTYTILEARDAIGGTWDLFRYPGIRSDSDMYTLGYAFRPWTDPKAIADGPSILAYVRDTARTYGIDSHIRFGHRVKRAAWSTATSEWLIEAERRDTNEPARIRCNFLFMCSGYYDYAEGHTPDFPGKERFTGRIVHPQRWTDDIDYAGKRVLVIGSGATAVTLVPEMAKTAAHVTMLQRSPTYIVAAPDRDGMANFLRERVSARVAYTVARWRNVLMGMLFYWFCQRHPARAKALLLRGVTRALGNEYDIARHFTPRYNPWNQRLCLVPNGDLFEAIKTGTVTVVTDEIDTFTEGGLRLRSKQELEADLIVTATGLNLQVLSNLVITVDEQRIDVAEAIAYKGMMLSGVPNFAWSMGYTNASWTLKCDLTCDYVCRLLRFMDTRGCRRCTPTLTDPTMARLPMLDFSSGYVQRSIAKFPKQGPRTPWRLYQNYLFDLVALRWQKLDDGVLQFAPPVSSLDAAEALS